MGKYPIISIIIPSYNSEISIKKTLESVNSQTFNNWECIIIDGKSKDKTIEIVNEYTKTDERFKLISEPDKGIYDAMNKGWKKAKGEWILFLGSDDSLTSPQSLDYLSNHLTKEYDVIYGNYKTTDINKNVKTIISLDYHCIIYKAFSNHQAVIMKRSVIENLGGFNTNYKITADFDLIQRAYLANFKFKQIPVIISNFYLGGVSSNNIKTYIEWWKVCKNNHSVKYPSFVLLYSLCRYIKNCIF